MDVFSITEQEIAKYKIEKEHEVCSTNAFDKSNIDLNVFECSNTETAEFVQTLEIETSPSAFEQLNTERTGQLTLFELFEHSCK